MRAPDAGSGWTLTRAAGAALIGLAGVLVGCGGGSAEARLTSAGTGSSQATPTAGPPQAPTLYTLVSPDGQAGQETIAAFGFDGAGALAPLAGAPFPTAGAGNRSSKASGFVSVLGGRYVVVAHNVHKALGCFATSADGSLAEVGRVGLAADPGDLAVHPDGVTVYASLGDSGTVAVVRVDPTSGALAEVAGSPFAVGTSVRDLDVDPSGRFLATGHMFGADNGVRIHALDAAGAVASPPVQSVPLSGRVGKRIAYGPRGDLLFALDLDRGVYAFQASLTAGLVVPVAGAPFSVGGFATGMAVHPAGGHVLVLRGNASPEVHVLSASPQGSLTPVAGSPFATPSGSYQHLGLTRQGDRVYLTERQTHEITGFAFAPLTGQLTQIAAPVVVSGTTTTTPRRAPGPILILD